MALLYSPTFNDIDACGDAVNEPLKSVGELSVDPFLEIPMIEDTLLATRDTFALKLVMLLSIPDSLRAKATIGHGNALNNGRNLP